ncbi:hypothetical protein ACROYT_G004059 [Oculina patagonica]
MVSTPDSRSSSPGSRPGWGTVLCSCSRLILQKLEYWVSSSPDGPLALTTGFTFYPSDAHHSPTHSVSLFLFTPVVEHKEKKSITPGSTGTSSARACSSGNDQTDSKVNLNSDEGSKKQKEEEERKKKEEEERKQKEEEERKKKEEEERKQKEEEERKQKEEEERKKEEPEGPPGRSDGLN